MILQDVLALIGDYWLYLAVALAIGAVAGWVTADGERE